MFTFSSHLFFPPYLFFLPSCMTSAPAASAALSPPAFLVLASRKRPVARPPPTLPVAWPLAPPGHLNTTKRSASRAAVAGLRGSRRCWPPAQPLGLPVNSAPPPPHIAPLLRRHIFDRRALLRREISVAAVSCPAATCKGGTRRRCACARARGQRWQTTLRSSVEPRGATICSSSSLRPLQSP